MAVKTSVSDYFSLKTVLRKMLSKFSLGKKAKSGSAKRKRKKEEEKKSNETSKNNQHIYIIK